MKKIIGCVLLGVMGLIILATLLNKNRGLTTHESGLSGIVIYDNANKLWTTRRFRDLDSYINTLNSDLGDYLHVKLLNAVYRYKNGAQVEESIALLERIHKQVYDEEFVFSPVFIGLLESRIKKYHDLKELYQTHGISREQRLTERTILRKTKFKHSSKWGDEALFFNAPEVFTTNNQVVALNTAGTPPPRPDLMSKTEKELKQVICGDNTPIMERKAAVKALVSQRRAAGLQEVAKGLYEAEMLYTYNDTADELVRAGRDAVPVILGLLDDPARALSQRKFLVWPLVRIGDSRPEVVRALRKVAAEAAPYSDDGAYAERALRHLQDRQGPL